MPNYIEGFVVPVPAANKDAYLARRRAPHGRCFAIMGAPRGRMLGRRYSGGQGHGFSPRGSGAGRRECGFFSWIVGRRRRCATTPARRCAPIRACRPWRCLRRQTSDFRRLRRYTRRSLITPRRAQAHDHIHPGHFQPAGGWGRSPAPAAGRGCRKAPHCPRGGNEWWSLVWCRNRPRAVDRDLPQQAGGGV